MTKTTQSRSFILHIHSNFKLSSACDTTIPSSTFLNYYHLSLQLSYPASFELQCTRKPVFGIWYNLDTTMASWLFPTSRSSSPTRSIQRSPSLNSFWLDTTPINPHTKSPHTSGGFPTGPRGLGPGGPKKVLQTLIQLSSYESQPSLMSRISAYCMTNLGTNLCNAPK